MATNKDKKGAQVPDTTEQAAAVNAAAADQAQGQDAAADVASTTDHQAAAPAVVEVDFGPDFVANADGAQALVALGFPLVVTVANKMPRRVTFPELQGLLLGHVAGLPELHTKAATFRDADQLHRFVTDVQALCELNKFVAGVTVKTA